MKNIVRLILLFLSILGLATLATTAFAAGGTGPGDALIPTGGAQSVAPNSRLWFRFDYMGNKSLITATLDSSDASHLAFFVYTPDEIRNWQNGGSLISIGQGTPGVGHDLNWTGRFNFGGTFNIAVRNNSSNPVTFTLNVTGDNVTTVVNVVPTPTPIPNPFATPIPVGSVSGGTIYFEDSAGGNIYRVNADGTGLTRITYGIDPALSPDGKLLAFARQGTPAGLFVANADGSNEHVVYTTNEVRSPSWSPDGSQIAFSYQAGSKGGDEVCRTFRNRQFCFNTPTVTQWRLKIINVADNSVIDPVATNDAFTPTWNANGTTIAFNDLSIGILQTVTNPPTGFAATPIIGDLRNTSPGYNPLRLRSPQYSPDGTRVVYMVEQQPTWQIAVANADGSNAHLLTSLDPFDFAPPNNVAPTWSPDGSQILFLSNRSGKWLFYSMNADGSNLRQVLQSVTDQITINYSYSGEHMAIWQ